MPLKTLLRLARINRVLVFHGLDELVLNTHLFRSLRYFAVLSPNFWIRRDHGPRGARIRRALEDLGPIFVKFGQALSTRRDLLPEDIADELAKLQDRVPAFSGPEARRIVERELGKPIGACFEQFDEVPLASASVAQVHAARLRSGEEVIVKVLRPQVETQVQRDIALLYKLAGLASRFWADGKRLRPVEVVAEFEKTILDELDLVREAANASALRRNFGGSKILYVPLIYWDWTRRKVLVMERIHGIPIGDVKRLQAEGVDFRLLAERGVEIFFTQVLRDNFFHADMHPGNIFATPESTYIAVDFGIVGSLSLADQHYLANNLLAFFHRDYRRVAELHIESGWVPKDTRVDELESGIRAVCEPIFEKPLGQISYGHLLLRLFQAARRFNAQIQPQLVLFQKTLLNIEGLGRDLYPQLDLWQTGKPILETWFAEQVGPKATFKKLQKSLPQWAEQIPEMPGLTHGALKNLLDGQIEVHWKSQQLDAIRSQLSRNRKATVRAIAGCAFLICAAILMTLTNDASQPSQSIENLQWGAFAFGVFLIGLALRD